jgi:cob(I)alamin adenosyltransferase
MNHLSELTDALSDICDKINAWQIRNGAKYDYNHILNGALAALSSGEKLEDLKNLLREIDHAYYRKGERISGYIQAGVISLEQARRLQDAIDHYLGASKDDPDLSVG